MLNLRKTEKLLRILASPRLWRAATIGVAAGVEHLQVLRHLKVRTVIDVGANRGQFSLACRFAHPSCKIIAFAPVPSSARVFRSVFRGDGLVFLREIAIGSEKREGIIHVAAREDTSSFLLPTETQLIRFPGSHRVRSLEVNIDTPDNHLASEKLDRPVLLKVDVEGYEMEVLRGVQDSIGDVDLVYIECPLAHLFHGQADFDSVYACLSNYGFALRGVFDTIPHPVAGLPVKEDFLFSRTDADDARECADERWQEEQLTGDSNEEQLSANS